MALSNLQALATRSLQPVTVTASSAWRRASSCTSSDAVNTKPGKICRIQHHSCRGSCLCSGNRGLVRFQRLRASSFQMGTAAHGNSGQQDPEPSVESAVDATDSSSQLQGREGLMPMLVDSLQGFQEGVKELRDRGVLECAKLGYQDSKEKLKNLDAKQLITGVKSSPLSTYGARWWRTSYPWVKWPIAVFVPFYLMVTVSFGLEVSQDLLPLWTLGPLGLGIVIRQLCRAADLSRMVVEKTANQRAQLSATTLTLYRDAREGKLLDKAKLLAESKSGELKQRVSTKRSEILVYVDSGQAATDTRNFLMNKAYELWECAVDQYADYMEWWRPKGRVISRFLKKIF